MSAALLVQLSDPHIGASWAPGDPLASLRAVLGAVRSLGRAPDALLLSGDLADHAADDEYLALCEALAPLRCPIHPLAGNHDDREALRRHFAVPGDGGTPLQYAVRIGGLRLIALDTTRPGADAGELDGPRLGWLDAELARERGTPTLVAMHHPPVAIGIPAADAIGLPAEDRDALAAIVARHGHVRALLAGHAHRSAVATLAGRPVLVAPSTHVQAALDLRATALRLRGEVRGFAVHELRDGGVVSHIELLAPAAD